MSSCPQPRVKACPGLDPQAGPRGLRARYAQASPVGDNQAEPRGLAERKEKGVDRDRGHIPALVTATGASVSLRWGPVRGLGSMSGNESKELKGPFQLGRPQTRSDSVSLTRRSVAPGVMHCEVSPPPTTHPHPKCLVTQVSWENRGQRNETTEREARRQILKVQHFAGQPIQSSPAVT